ncbi:hypothetical protein GCM10009564_47450 [Streptomyces thermogriseus]|uniref:Uncharacterized protein n=1 Tax=Streptomyces thermogriseus TaxID=75292 RepID=A0ABN1T539_9ACTN
MLDERGKTGEVTSPSANSTEPSAPSSTRLPRCRPSTNPERTTSARTGEATDDDAAGADGAEDADDTDMAVAFRDDGLRRLGTG